MAGRGVDIILGGNPEGLARRDVHRRRARSRQRGGPGALPGAAAEVRGRDRGRGRQGARARRAVRARHRAPREPAHRQPVARPFRPSGRPGREPLLPVARRRAHAHLRHGRHELGHDQGACPTTCRSRRAWSPRRSSGRRTPSSSATPRSARSPQVRRGDERAAQGHLQAPRPDPRRRRPARGGDRVPRRRGRVDDLARTASPTTPRNGTSTASLNEVATYWPSTITKAQLQEAHRPPTSCTSC